MRYLVSIRAGIGAVFIAAGCAGSPDPSSPEWEEAASMGLVPVKRVQPEYPRRAALAGVQGCVTASFDVMPDGRTDNYLVVDSKPQGVFVKTALLALRDWRFPEREQPVRTQQTITFELRGQRTGELPECDSDPDLPETYQVEDG
jgi:TonB family protein